MADSIISILSRWNDGVKLRIKFGLVYKKMI